jgi:D-tyrosyl-tRNA(Tyr) deacylase
MRLLIQRVKEAKVTVQEQVVGEIQKGLLLFLGIEETDTLQDVDWLIKKVIQLRIFNDENGKMNLSIQDVQGDFLVVSQFTLHASYKKGNRPSFARAASGEKAKSLYETFVQKLKEAYGKPVQTGIFGAYMQVHLINDGPVTILMDSQLRE